MGITIKEMDILDGLMKGSNLYSHIRDIEVSKQENGEYILRFIILYYLENEKIRKNVSVEIVEEIIDIEMEEFDKSIWKVSYNILKKKLMLRGLSITDNF